MDFLNRRETKILTRILITLRTGIPMKNLTFEEKEFVKRLVEFLEEERNKLRGKLSHGSGENS